MATVTFKCEKRGHLWVQRLTTQRPSADHIDGTSCGYCARDGVESAMQRVGR